MFQIAEKQQSITSKDFITQLNLTCKYISERIDFNNNFGNTILPLELKTFSEENIEVYKEGFYYGVSAKYEHILAGVDVIRNDRLSEIQNAFKQSNVVFIHGASGQGKTTLAYRYLKDNQSQFASYELKLKSNYKEVLQTINSLDALCKNLKFPIVLYIDVTSHYLYWEEIIKELYDKTNIYFLVTIRQEDWNKLSLDQYFSFSDIELNFDKAEANALYSRISQHKTDLKFIDFEESWKHIGENSPLLEYIYLLTQGETLKSRLKQQLARIQEKVESLHTKDIEILRFVCLADSYDSRINYKKLVTYLKINSPITYIDFFQKEYLLQLTNDNNYLIGLHPVRSRIISEILFDHDMFIDKFKYIDKTLSLIHEHDLHNFLLKSFDDDYNIDRCINSLSKVSFKTWSGYKNVVKGFIWKGIYDYIFNENRSVFDELYEKFKDAWQLFLNIDFSGLNKDKSILDIVTSFQKDEAARLAIIKDYKSINSKLSPIENVFKYCQQWLNNKTQIRAEANEDIDWDSYGELLFWTKQFNASTSIEFEHNTLITYFENTDSINSMSTILLGLKTTNKLGQNNIKTLEEIFNKRIRKKYNIIELNISDKKISTKYFFDLLDDDEETEIKPKNPFHERTLEIQYLLRKAFPEKQEFEIKGYSYNILNIDMPDDTYKCMPIENLPLKYFTELNALIINLNKYTERLDTWNEYVDKIVETREAHLEALHLIKKGLILYFKDNDKGVNHFIQFEKEIKEKINKREYFYPKCAVDKWGYLSESNQNDPQNQRIDKYYLLHKFENFKTTKQNYFRHTQNFINQSFTEIVNTLKKINDPNFEAENENLKNITEINLSESLISLVRFHDEFENHFNKFFDPIAIKRLLKMETNTLVELLTIWKTFLYSPYRINKNVGRYAVLNFDQTRNQLHLKIYNEFLRLQKEYGYLHNMNIDKLNKRLVIQINSSSAEYFDSLQVYFEFIISVFASMKHTSIKNLITKINFDKVSAIILFNGNPVNNKYLEIPIFRIDYICEKLNSEEEINSIFEIFDFPEDITKNLLDSEGLIPWNQQIPLINKYEQFMGLFNSIKFIISQIQELQTEFCDLDDIGQEVFNNYQKKAFGYFGVTMPPVSVK